MCDMRFTLLTVLLSAAVSLAAERGEEIRLWPTSAPGSEGMTAAEVSRPSTNARYSKWPGAFTVTHYPSIYVFLPPKEKATEPAMVVAPGWGRRQIVSEQERWEMRDWRNNCGIAD